MKKTFINFKIIKNKELSFISAGKIKRGVKITVFFTLLNYQMGKKFVVCKEEKSEEENDKARIG